MKHLAPSPSPVKLSVVAPCFNEEAVLPEFVQRVEAACRSVVGEAFEIVLVNDGSRDGTWPLISRLAAKAPHIVGVNLSRNVGHQLALTAGLSLSRGDRVLIVDADLQDPPELLPTMMQMMDGGADVVYGQRVQRDGEGVFKRSTAFLFYRLLSLFAEVAIPSDTGDFRLMTRRVVDALNTMPERYRFIRGMVAWLGYVQVPLEYTRDRRHAGATKYSLLKMSRFAVDAVTGFSISPLRLSSMLALACFVLAALLGSWVVYAWLAFEVVPGWSSILTAFLVFTGMQMLVLGVIGEYVGRTFMEVKRRPLYMVSEIITQGAVDRVHERRI